MFEVTITTNREDHLRWISSLAVTGDKLECITQELALEFERALKEILQADTKRATGATSASVESWPLSVTPDHVQYAVGSRTRGHILRFLDRGRGWVYPKNRLALRFWIEGEKIFSMYSRPSPPLFVMYRAAQIAFSKLDEIVRRNIT